MRFHKCSALFASFALLPVISLTVAAQKTPKKTTSASTASTPAPAPAAMTNDDVIALAGAGLPDDVLIAKIHAARSTSFDTSVTGLKALKVAGVSSGVIRYMIDPTAPPAASVATAPAPPNPDDPSSNHSPGVYMLAKGNEGAVHMSKLDHVNAEAHKSSGAFLSGMTYGITKAHVKAVVAGPRATVQTLDTNPVFYAYIPEDNVSFGGNAISVRDLSLIRFDPKDNSREINQATISPWGSSVGTDEKSKQGFDSEQLRPGVYKITLLRPLPSGQYAFQHQNFGAFFDFGVIPAK